MRVANLLAAAAQLLAARLVGAAHQARIAEEVANLGKAADVVDLVKQHQGQNLADAGHGTQRWKVLTSSTLAVRVRYSSTSPRSVSYWSMRARSTSIMRRTLGSAKRSATWSSSRLAA